MGQALTTPTGDSNIMASTEIRLYARISELRTVPGVTSWESVTVPAHKNKSDTQHARELSAKDPSSVYAVYSKYTSIIRFAYYNGVEFAMTSNEQFAPLTMAKAAWEQANGGDAPYTMWAYGHDGKFHFHMRAHSLPYLKAVGRLTYGKQAPRTKTWYILDATGQQVIGRFEGRQTKDNVVELIEARKKAIAKREAALITQEHHTLYLFSNDTLRSISLQGLCVQIRHGVHDLNLMAELGKETLTPFQLEALDTLAKAMAEAERVLAAK